MAKLSDEELDAIIARIGRGDDPHKLPPELVDEPSPPVRPAASGDGDREEQEKRNRSLAYLIRGMKVGERLKLALKGNHDARSILIRDPTQIVARFVLQNPRVTDDEIVGFARNRNLDSELLRIIGEQKQWSRNPQVRSALVSNPKTPIAIALRFVNSLSERELRLLAKSRNVSTAISGSAKRILFQRTGKI
jgi:hypothetical protein